MPDLGKGEVTILVNSNGSFHLLSSLRFFEFILPEFFKLFYPIWPDHFSFNDFINPTPDQV